MLTLDGLERGDAPRIEYFTADGVVLPGEGLQPLDDSYQAMVPSGDTWLALSPGLYELRWLNENFEPIDQVQINENFVSNPDRSWVAYTTVDQAAQTLVQAPTNGGSLVSAEFPAVPQVDPVDFVGDGEVLYQTTDSRGRHQTIGISSDDGEVEFEGRFVKAIAANPETGLVTVQTESNADGSGCFGVVDPAVSTAESVWDTCDYSLGCVQSRRQVRARQRSVPVGRRPCLGERAGRADRRPGGELPAGARDPGHPEQPGLGVHGRLPGLCLSRARTR